MPSPPAHLERHWSTTLDRGLLVPEVTVNGAGESLVVCAIPDGHFSAHNALVRLTANGKVVWTKQVAGSDAMGALMCSALDASGNAIVAGGFRTQIDFGRPLQGNATLDAYVVKLDRSGGFVWGARFGDAGVQQVDGVMVDAAGNVVIAGTFEGTIDLGVGALSATGETDAFVAMLGPSGEALWSRRLGGTGADKAIAIATDARGNIIVAVGNGMADPRGSIVIRELNHVGELLWSTSLYDVGVDQIATDGDGNVFVVGAVGRGCIVTNTSRSRDTALVKLDARGRRIWTRRLGNRQDWRSGIAVDRRHVIAPIEDTSRSWSLVFVDAAGRIEGRAPLETFRVGGVAIDARGNIVVAEQGVADEPNRVFVEAITSDAAPSGSGTGDASSPGQRRGW